MTASIERVAVIGAGTMGAAIAAHVANAGLPVLLLDIVPRELDDKEKKKGLGLEHPAVRNRIAKSGFERIAKLKPASLMSAAARDLVEIGNLEDDLERVAEADWIVEAIIEKLSIKRSLMERLDSVRRAGTIVTTNTSGLPIAKIVEGRSDDFRRHFFGTHFFNPPRYMKLLEIIRGDETDPAAVKTLAEFTNRHLGKGVVYCKDTPNFIGNRLFSVDSSRVMEWGLEHGYRVEEVDAVAGPLIGRPKTAIYRLQDLVGIDVAAYVGQNLYELIPEDPRREALKAPKTAKVIGGLMERGWLGNKSGQGFYKKSKGKGGRRVFEVLNPETFDYEPPRKVEFESLAVAGRIPDLGERLRTLFSERVKDDRGAQLAWAAVSSQLSYASETAQETAFDLVSVDRAVCWGFNQEIGPFEIWDELGVATTADRIESDGLVVAPWVRDMLAAGCDTFYRRDGVSPPGSPPGSPQGDRDRVTGYYDWNEKAYVDLPSDPRHIAVEDLRAGGKEVASNKSASLHDLGEEVLLLEFHSKMNSIDDGLVAMINTAAERLESGAWKGLVIGNDGPNFCVGANLKNVAEAAAAGQFDSIRDASGELQAALQRLKYGPRPVVAAVHGMALGGGAEVTMGAHRVVAASESYIGLVEVGVGVLPGGGGLKELVRRLVTAGMAVEHADPLLFAQKILETVAMAKTSTSAAEAAELGFLAAGDRVVMNRDHRLHEARQEVLTMAAEGWTTPAPASLYAGGRDLLAALKMAVWSLAQAGYASAHDAMIANKIAYVIAGGDGSAARWVDEEHFLRLEREAFAELCATEKTQQRIVHMLKTGKPLRN